MFSWLVLSLVVGIMVRQMIIVKYLIMLMNVNYDNNDKKNWNKDKSAYDHHNYD